MKMTWTIMMVCLCYFIFVMPISVLNMADPDIHNPELHLVSYVQTDWTLSLVQLVKHMLFNLRSVVRMQ